MKKKEPQKVSSPDDVAWRNFDEFVKDLHVFLKKCEKKPGTAAYSKGLVGKGITDQCIK